MLADFSTGCGLYLRVQYGGVFLSRSLYIMANNW
jgi:hypothetical protein